MPVACTSAPTSPCGSDCCQWPATVTRNGVPSKATSSAIRWPGVSVATRWITPPTSMRSASSRKCRARFATNGLAVGSVSLPRRVTCWATISGSGSPLSVIPPIWRRSPTRASIGASRRTRMPPVASWTYSVRQMGSTKVTVALTATGWCRPILLGSRRRMAPIVSNRLSGYSRVTNRLAGCAWRIAPPADRPSKGRARISARVVSRLGTGDTMTGCSIGNGGRWFSRAVELAVSPCVMANKERK